MKKAKVTDPVLAAERRAAQLETRWQTLRRDLADMTRRHQNERDLATVAEREAYREMHEAFRDVAVMPAATLAGIAAKLRQIQSERAGDIADADSMTSAIADLERLAGGAASG
jgi:hypothetical protein